MFQSSKVIRRAVSLTIFFIKFNYLIGDESNFIIINSSFGVTDLQ